MEWSYNTTICSVCQVISRLVPDGFLNNLIAKLEILKKRFNEEENRLGKKKQTTDFIQSIKQESVTLKNLRKVISFIDPLVSKERAKYFKATPVGLKYPSDPEVAANGFIGIDFSPISEEFIKRVIMNLVLFQMQIQMLQKMKVRTMLFVDEMHDVIAASNHGGPDSESILKKISDEGRSNGMILIGAAQILSKLLESIAGKHLADNASWIVQMGRPEFDEANRQGESAVNALRNLGATEDDIKYLKALTENEIGQGLLIVKGQSPLQFKVDFASYIHRWITGEEKTIESDRVLGPVLRFAKFEKKYHRSLMNTMGYRSIRHKDLNNVSTDFLFRKTEDPELAIDLFLIEEYFKKQGIEVIPDYESGLISVNNGETLIYIQPYNGNTFTPEELVSQLDEEPDHNQWFIIYHDDEYKSIMTEALKSNIILREDIPMNVEKIIKTNS